MVRNYFKAFLSRKITRKIGCFQYIIIRIIIIRTRRLRICQQRLIRASVIYTLTNRQGRYKLSHFYSTCSSKFNISLTSRKDNARILSIQQFKYIILNYLFHQTTVIKGYVRSVRISNLSFHFFYSADKTILTFRHMAQSVHNCFDFTVTLCAAFSL